MPHITKKFKFCAAHQYWNIDWDAKKNREVFREDSRLHGHNYTLEVTVKGFPDPDTGFVTDLSEIKRLVNEKIINVIDHSRIEKDLTWFKDKQPSTENMVIWMWNEIEPEITSGKLYRIRLVETPTIYTDYFGPEN